MEDSEAGNVSKKDQEETMAALQVAIAQLQEAVTNLKKQQAIRQSNLNPDRPGEDVWKKLDSSVKRNTSLIKKLRQISEETKSSLVDDIQRVNQSKYVSEAVSAVAECQLKTKDLSAAVQVCSLLHQRYAEFSEGLLTALRRNFGAAAKSSDDERSLVTKRRATLRLLGDLLTAGVYNDASVLLGIIQSQAFLEFKRDRDGAQAALSLLVGFCKAGKEDFLGFPANPPFSLDTQIIPQDVKNASDEMGKLLAEFEKARSTYQRELQQSAVVSADMQQSFRKAVEKAFDLACSALEEEHSALTEVERENSRVLNSRGELPEELAAAYEQQRKAFETLQRTVASLAELLERSMPKLATDDMTRVAEDGAGSEGKEADEAAVGPFEDDEARAFYESLVDIRAVVPAILLGDVSAEKDKDKDGAEGGAGSGQPVSPTATEAGAVNGESGVASAGDAVPAGSDARSEAEALFARLPACASRDMCDEWAVAFCYASQKASRKRLVRVMYDVPPGSLALVPFYARIAATLSQVFPDVGQGLAQAAEEDFKGLQAQRDVTQRTYDARLRVARWLGELAKFRLLPFGTLFSCLKALLDDFQGQSVDTAAALVETAGRFLHYTPETITRMANMMQVMLKLKNARNLDARQAQLVDAAALSIRPRERALRRKRRPPQLEYMRHLVLDRLADVNIKTVLKKLRKFPWAEHEAALVRVLLKAIRGSFGKAPLIAALAAGLARYHPTLGVAVVDELLEQVRCGLEDPLGGAYQRRVAHMRLLGEFYNYRLIDSRVAFDTLYLLLSFGHESPEEAEILDPPDNFFRIRLACTLLETCGQYFSKGSAARRLDTYLVYLQRYILAKPQLPLDVEFDVQDLLEHLRPKLERFASFEKACAAVEALEAERRERGGSDEEQSGSEDGEDELGSDDESGGARARGMDAPASEAGSAVASQVGLDDGDERVHLLSSAPLEVDEEFEREFAALMLAAPPPKAPPAGGGPQAGVPGSGTAGVAAQPGETVAFKVMMKRGGREDRSHAVQVPANSGIAVSLQAQTQAEQAERAQIKTRVLQAERVQQQEAAAPMAPKPVSAALKPQTGGYYARGRGLAGAEGFFMAPGTVEGRGRGRGGGRGRGRGRQPG